MYYIRNILMVSKYNVNIGSAIEQGSKSDCTNMHDLPVIRCARIHRDTFLATGFNRPFHKTNGLCYEAEPGHRQTNNMSLRTAKTLTSMHGLKFLPKFKC